MPVPKDPEKYALYIQRQSIAQSEPLEGRFWKYVNKQEACWLWTGARTDKRYGVIQYKGLPRRAHRVSWELAYGPIPSDMLVCHHCDKPLCVRPDHLFLGTNADNVHDCVAKGRRVAPERISAMNRGRAHVTQRGVPRSPEVRAKISAALKGRPGISRPLSEEAKKKISEVKRGKPLSMETRERMRLAQLGRKHPPEVKAKISFAHKRRLGLIA